MSEFWKSNPKFYCEYCKVWILDNKASRRLHEGGNKHKANVRMYLHNIQKKKTEKDREEKDLMRQLEQMKKAANKQLEQHAVSGFATTERRFDIHAPSPAAQDPSAKFVAPTLPPPTLEELQRAREKTLYDPELSDNDDSGDDDDSPGDRAENDSDDDSGSEANGDSSAGEGEEGDEDEDGNRKIVIPKSKKRKTRDEEEESTTTTPVTDKHQVGIQGQWEEVNEAEAQSAWGLPFQEKADTQDGQVNTRQRRTQREKTEMDSSDSDIDDDALTKEAKPAFLRRRARHTTPAVKIEPQSNSLKLEKNEEGLQEQEQGTAAAEGAGGGGDGDRGDEPVFKKRKFGGAASARRRK